MKKPQRIVLPAMICVALSSCGQKGDLYLPAQPDQETPTAESEEDSDDKDDGTRW